MPINKNAVIRYKTLDKCFRNSGRNYLINDLLDAVNNALFEDNPNTNGIQIRQLRSDIRFMKSTEGFSAPIKTIRHDGNWIYRYSDSSFSFNQSPLNATETEKLKSALSILQRFEGSIEFEWMAEIAPLLNDHFGLKNDQRKIIGHDTNIDYTGYKWINTLFNAISNEQVLDIHYKTFDGESFKFKFHPHYLKQYNKRWFAFGLNQDKEKSHWNVALDRIEEIKETDGKYISCEKDWEDYFYDIVGVTVPSGLNKPENVLLKFSKEQAPYVITKPLHLSQKPPKYNDDGTVEIRIKVIPNNELERLILSYGSGIEVLEPIELRERIVKTIKQTADTYLCK